MLCPIGREPLIIVEVEHVELDMCADGHGLWFDTDELRQLFEVTGVPAELHDLEKRLERMKHPRGVKKRRCPRCNAKMWQVAAPGPDERIILDACPFDHGLWFDQGELEAILATQFGEDDEALQNVKGYLGGFVEPPDE